MAESVTVKFRTVRGGRQVLRIRASPVSLTPTSRYLQIEGDVVSLKVKTETLMGKLIRAWETKKGVGEKVYQYMFDGKNLDPVKTVAEHEISDGDFVDVAIAQVGGRL